MKNVIKILLVLLVTQSSQLEAVSQTYGGQIKAKNNPGVIGDIGRANDNLKVYDSAVLSKLNASIAVTGTFFQATQPVSLASLPSLAAGSNNIGDVDVLTVPADPFGANADAASATGSISGKLRFIASTGIPITGTVTVGSHAVTNAGTFATQVDGAALTALQLIDNLPNTLGSTTSGQSGALALGAVTTAAPSYTTAQTNALSLQTDGSLRVAVTSMPSTTVTATNLSTNMAQVAGTNTVTAGVSGMIAVGGNTANNVAITSNPLLLGAQGVSSENAAVTTSRGVQLVADLVGKLITLPYANPENFVSGAITTAMTGTTSTSLIAAPSSGLRNYITTIVVSNSSATVGTDIIIQDGSGGTTLMTIPGAAIYGGAVINLPVPLRQPTTATAIFCANVTTGASTKVSAVGYIGK